VGDVRGIPRVTVTGTNGKTTTTRFLAHLASEAGHLVGRTSSDAVVIGEDTVERGDWTGPGATRRVLRDPRVTFAALETARGGLLRRGLAVDGADVAVLTNVAEEHLGEWGIDDLDDLARAKMITGEGLRPGGTLIVPAHSPPIRRVVAEFSSRRPDVRVWTYSPRPVPGASAWADDRFLHFGDSLIPVAEVPITFSGTARHNVENTLCATLAALAAKVPGEAISRGLRSFRPSVGDNPGRMNTYRLPCGALVVLDFAHNAHGLERIVDTVSRWNKPRRVLLLGQAGDRPDVDLESLASAAVPLGAERIVLKDVTGRLHGRPPGQVPAILHRRLVADGVPPERISVTPDEVTGVRLALRGATHEHVIVALLHETLAAALAVVREAGGVSIDG
jgi:UDP-N-acetylmuramyl tripeptide synthase